MRSAHKIRITQMKSLQKNYKEKIDKQVQTMNQLLEIPDLDVSQFFQNLLKSQRSDEVLSRIPQEKKIDYFARNYVTFLQTQDQLLHLQLPTLQQIPKAKKYTFQKPAQAVQEQNFDEASVLQIIDSFSSAVLQKNTPQILRFNGIINEMRKHGKYKKYFNYYSINKIFLQNYNSFVQSCNDYQILFKLEEVELGIRVYLGLKQEQIMQLIKTNLNVNDSILSIGKEMSSLINFMEKEIKVFKSNPLIQRVKKSQNIALQLNVYLTEWISKLTKRYYQLIQSFIYQKEELSEIMGALGIIIEASSQLESKGICLQRQIKELISNDLPSHVAKVIEIIVQSIKELLKEDNTLYEFVYLKSLKTFSDELAMLQPLPQAQYGKKCSTIKGIILVNTFSIILMTLCDDKWAFLHQYILGILIEKVALNIMNASLLYWDYYQIYAFFDKLKDGRVRHKILFNGDQISLGMGYISLGMGQISIGIILHQDRYYLTLGQVLIPYIVIGMKQKIDKINKLTEESWQYFQDKLTKEYWMDVLSYVPAALWQFKKYAQTFNDNEMKPSVFSLDIIFRLEDFFKHIQFRVSPNELEILLLKFYQYLIYVMEYTLFINYHQGGTKQNVFMLSKKSQKLFKTAKEFNIQGLKEFKNGMVLRLSLFTKKGMKKFAFEMYFLTQVLKYLTGCLQAKIDPKKFLLRLVQILAKQQKNDPESIDREQFQQNLDKMLKYFKQRPQVMRAYLKERSEKDNSINSI